MHVVECLVLNFRKLCSLFPLLSAIVVVLEMERWKGRYRWLGGATAQAVDLISWSSGSDRMPNFGMVNLLVKWWPYKNFLPAWRRQEGRQIHYISVFCRFLSTTSCPRRLASPKRLSSRKTFMPNIRQDGHPPFSSHLHWCTHMFINMRTVGCYKLGY